MLRALLGLFVGALVAAIVAVLYGKLVADMRADDFEPVLLAALGLGALIGLVVGLLSRKRRPPA